MKKTMKLCTIAMVMVLAISMIFAGCSKSGTLEEYFAENPKEQESLDNFYDIFKDSGMNPEMKIEKNEIIYKMKFPTTISEDQIEEVKDQLEQSMTTSFGPMFVEIMAEFERQTKIDGITCTFIIQDDGGTELYNNTFEVTEEE